jgi:hypothetical protein
MITSFAYYLNDNYFRPLIVLLINDLINNYCAINFTTNWCLVYYSTLFVTFEISYIKEKKEDFELRGDKFEISDYLKEYENEAEKLLHFESKNGCYTKTTFITWKITIENIKQKEHGQRSIERFANYGLFCSWQCSYKHIFSEPVVDEKSLWDAMKLLNQYSMINVEKGVQAFTD